MRMILDAVDKRALQNQVSFSLTLVVHLGLFRFVNNKMFITLTSNLILSNTSLCI